MCLRLVRTLTDIRSLRKFVRVAEKLTSLTLVLGWKIKIELVSRVSGKNLLNSCTFSSSHDGNSRSLYRKSTSDLLVYTVLEIQFWSEKYTVDTSVGKNFEELYVSSDYSLWMLTKCLKILKTGKQVNQYLLLNK